MFVKRAILWLLSLSLLLAVPVRAAEAEAVRCFSASDFSSGEEGLLGICVTELSGAACGLYCQGRPVAAGDVLTAAQLDQLTAAGRDSFTAEASLSFLPVFTDGIGAQETVVITLRGTENQPPETAAYRVETYKNVAVTEPFRCSDADGDAITFRIVKEPRRGSVTVHADGTFTYTPNPEKVGNDHFTFIAADSRGAESPETRMDIRINKVSSGVFADMTGDPNEREALFLRTNGLLSGEYVAMTLCFRPEQPVSREEFLMMTMKLTGLEPESADDTDWFSPWQTAALRAGLPSLSAEIMTKQDAAAWVSALTETEDSSVMVWSSEEPDALLTRRDAAVLLYRLHVLHEEGLSFPWEAE